MSARTARFRLRSISAAFLVVTAAGWSSDDSADGPDGTVSSSKPGSSAPVEVTVETYLVESGDAVSEIADEYCVSAAALAEANEWNDGVNHVIQPGDAIAIRG